MDMDHLGTLRGDKIIWKNFEGHDVPFEENGESIDSTKVILSGLVSG